MHYNLKTGLSFLTVILFFYVSPFMVYAQENGYRVEINRLSTNEWQLDFEITDYNIIEKNINHSVYSYPALKGAGQGLYKGDYVLPVIHRFFSGSGDSIPEITVISIQTEKTTASPPAVFNGPVPRNRPVSENFSLNLPLKNGSEDNSLSFFTLGQHIQPHGVPIYPITLKPFQYDPSESSYLIYKSFSLKITTFGKAVSINPVSKSQKNMIKKFLPDWKSRHKQALINEPYRLIILTDDIYLDSVQLLVEWKTRKGFETRLIAKSEISPFPDAGQIKDFLDEIYIDWPFDFLFIIGDPRQIPMFYGINNALTDHPYSVFGSDDYLPEIAVGRLSVINIEECGRAVRKMVNYERFQLSTDPEWYQNSSIISSNVNSDDHHSLHIAHHFWESGFQTVDTLRHFNGSNTRQNVLDGINGGLSWLVYLGHGHSTGWSNVDPGFGNADIDILENDGKLPAIVSIACANADLDNQTGSCFAEQWINASSNTGAGNFIGSTEDCYFFWSDTLGKHALFNYLNGGSTTFGEALNLGKIATYLAFPQPKNSFTEETLQHFIVVGDPTQMPWTSAPAEITVSHPKVVRPGNTFQILVSKDGLPVSTAQTGLTSSDLAYFAGGFTDNQGFIEFTPGNETDTLWITVTGRNLKPYESFIIIGDDPNSVSNNYHIYPNPIDNQLNISHNQLSASKQYADLIDISGRKVFSFNIQPDHNYTYELPEIPNGFYIISIIEDGKSVHRQKIVVKGQ